MNQRPFISTNLNIFDENRCVFTPSTIGGQPVMISQEQNRKIYDTLSTAIASNQPQLNNWYCACQQQIPTTTQPQLWSCSRQAQKQGIPGGVMFNFTQPNYCCPPSCLPSAYSPPPPPAPQIMECPSRTPQSVCVDFGKYGLEAMMFQQKCRQQYSGFTYDKQVGTCDQNLFPKCCGIQAPTLKAEEKEELFHRIDETDCKQKLKICSQDTSSMDRKRCSCFPKPDPNKYGCPKTLVIRERSEKCCKDYDIVEQAGRELDAEAYLCCDCLDRWKKENECKRPSCLKKDDDCCNKELRGAKKAVSFSICNGALSISENKSCVSHSEEKLHQQKMKTSTSDTAKSSADDIFVCKENLSDEHIDCEKTQCQYIRQITQLKKRRKGMIKMGSFMNEILTEAITSADNEIDELRDRREAAHAVKGSSICLKSCRKEKSEKTFKDKSVATKISEDIKEFTNTVVENLEDKKYSTVKDIQLTSSSKSEQNGSKRSSIESNSKNLERIPIVANRSPSRINSLLEEKDSDELLLSSLFEARNKFAARKKRNSFEGNIQGKSNTNSLRGISEAIDFDQKNLSEKVNDKHEKVDQHKAEGVKNDVLCSESVSKSDKQEDAYGGSSSSAASKVEDLDTKHKAPELSKKISLHSAKVEETLGEDMRPLMTEKNDQKEFEETAFETNKKEQNKENEPDTLNKNVHVGEASHKTPENTGNENSPHFQRCTCGRNPVSKIGNIISSICSTSFETVSYFLQNLRNSRTPCLPVQQCNYGECYKGRINRCITQANRARSFCSCDIATNKYCGRTCYDVDRNLWYSCCPDFVCREQNVVTITFRESAERRMVFLDNACRNSRYHVIYE